MISKLVAVIEDAAVSGSIALAKRPAGQHLADALKRHGATNIVAWKLDRVFRDCADALVQTQAWDKAGIALHLIDMGGGSVDTRSSSGRLMLTMLAGFGEFERRVIGERTKAALARKKELGQRTGGVPYGKRLAGGTGKQLEPDPAEQIVVALARQLRAAGNTLQRICDALEAAGYRSRTGRKFIPCQVHRMLTA